MARFFLDTPRLLCYSIHMAPARSTVATAQDGRAVAVAAGSILDVPRVGNEPYRMTNDRRFFHHTVSVLPSRHATVETLP